MEKSPKSPDNPQPGKNLKAGVVIACGIALGAALGVVLDNSSLGVGIGLGVGVALGFLITGRKARSG